MEGDDIWFVSCLEGELVLVIDKNGKVILNFFNLRLLLENKVLLFIVFKICVFIRGLVGDMFDIIDFMFEVLKLVVWLE